MSRSAGPPTADVTSWSNDLCFFASTTFRSSPLQSRTRLFPCQLLPARHVGLFDIGPWGPRLTCPLHVDQFLVEGYVGISRVARQHGARVRARGAPPEQLTQLRDQDCHMDSKCTLFRAREMQSFKREMPPDRPWISMEEAIANPPPDAAHHGPGHIDDETMIFHPTQA